MQNHLETLENHILVKNIWLAKETTHKKLKVKRTLLNDYKYKDALKKIKSLDQKKINRAIQYTHKIEKNINKFGYEIENWHTSINSLINNYIKI